jgi:hypothetical protein
VGAPAALAVRAERLQPLAAGSAAPDGANALACRPIEEIYRGKYIDISAESAAGRIKIRRWDRASAQEVSAVTWRRDDCVVLPA